jgi:hypothetical protein
VREALACVQYVSMSLWVPEGHKDGRVPEGLARTVAEVHQTMPLPMPHHTRCPFPHQMPIPLPMP